MIKCVLCGVELNYKCDEISSSIFLADCTSLLKSDYYLRFLVFICDMKSKSIQTIFVSFIY